eukprot:3620283-Prymnesium_polylepis.1
MRRGYSPIRQPARVAGGPRTPHGAGRRRCRRRTAGCRRCTKRSQKWHNSSSLGDRAVHNPVTYPRAASSSRRQLHAHESAGRQVGTK